MTLEWANQVVTRLRIDKRWVIAPGYYAEQKALLLSLQDMTPIKQYFDDPEFLRNVRFEQLPVWEKLRNILTDEIKKSGIKPYINATDPAAEDDKKSDLFKLQARQAHENNINQNKQAIGLPNYKMGKEDFNGNVDKFDQIGLDPNNPSDVNFFFDSHYKLNYETNAQILVDAFLDLNEVEFDIPRYVNDVLCCKCVCKQEYISPISGQIVTKYLQPSQTFAIFGRRRDGKDAKCRGWEMQIPVTELLNQLGNAFNFERDWLALISAINYGSNTTFDGFIKGGNTYTNLYNGGNLAATEIPNPQRELNLLNWDNYMTYGVQTYNYMVYFGYIEWEQQCSTIEKRNTKTGQRFTVNNAYEPTKSSLYEKESWNYLTIKTSNYIATGAFSQKLYGYGDMYHQLTEGQYDEYSRGSISIIRYEGKSATEISWMYITLANYAYYKMLWAIHRSRPDIWDFSFESIRDVAMKLMPQTEGTNAPQAAGAFGNAVNDLIEKFQRKMVMMHTYPISDDGQVMGGGSSPHIKIPGSLDPLAVELKSEILEWAEFQITDKIGLGGLREANAPNPKDGLKLNEMYLKQSRAATGYIPDMLQSSFEHSAKLILLYVQDILRFKSDIPYKYLLKFVGEKVLTSVERLADIAAHRYAIFVTSLDTQAQLEEIWQQAALAQQQGQITYSQYLLIRSIKEPRLASIQFAYMEERAAKKKQSDAMALQQQAAQNQMQLQQMMQQTEMLRQQGGIRVAELNKEAVIAGKQIDYKAKIDTKAMQTENEVPKISAKTESQQQVLETKSNLDSQKAVPA